MDQRFDPGCCQMFSEIVPVFGSDDIVLVGIEVTLAFEMRQREITNVLQTTSVYVSDMPPMLNPRGKMPQFDVKDGGLNVVQQGRVPMMVKLSRPSVFAVESQQGREPCNFWIICSDSATVA
jgi:hypothetical protein